MREELGRQLAKLAGAGWLEQAVEHGGEGCNNHFRLG